MIYLFEGRLGAGMTYERTGLFVVWIDVNLGSREPEWERNSGPQPLAAALDEAARLRVAEWPTKVRPEA